MPPEQAVTYTGLLSGKGSKKKLKPLDRRLHAHGCTQCSRRYSDACAQATVNALCQACKGRQRPIWELDLDPQACCEVNSVPVTRPEKLMNYRLAGDMPWWICVKCCRTIPFNPAKKDR